MFERATIFSSVFVLIVFTIFGVKYYRLFERQNRALIFPDSSFVGINYES